MAMRTYPVPAVVKSPFLGHAPTFDIIDTFVSSGHGDPKSRRWAINILERETERISQTVYGTGSRVPLGFAETIADTDVVVALTDEERVWQREWQPRDERFANSRPVYLTEPEVTAFAHAVMSGASGLALSSRMPLGFAYRDTIRAAAVSDPPAGSRVIAIVDELDKKAVLDLIAISPGPVVQRRHDGQWIEDPGALAVLRSVKPPPVVSIAMDKVADIASQVDESTAGVEWEVTEIPTRAAAYLVARHDEMLTKMILMNMRMHPIISAGRMPAQLKKYWLSGAGAAKIRWGTPGAMRRCHRQLKKYVGPGRAWQTCNNIAQHIGGKGVAWDVGG